MGTPAARPVSFAHALHSSVLHFVAENLSLPQARIFHFSGFLSDEECDHIIAVAKDRMRRSGVVDQATGGTKLDDIRTSVGGSLLAAKTLSGRLAALPVADLA